MQMCVEGLVQINLRQFGRPTLLQRVAGTECFSLAECLITLGADDSPSGASQESGLQIAARTGNLPTVHLFLKTRGINAQDGNRDTAVHIAARSVNVDVLHLLLRARPNVEMRDSAGRTALHVAADESRLQAARLLLQAGSRSNTADDHHNTALHIAVDRGYSPIVEVLLKAGVNVGVHNAVGETALHQAVENHREDTVRNPLHDGSSSYTTGGDRRRMWYHAGKQNHPEIVKRLVAGGANVDDRDAAGLTALHRAVCQRYEQC